MATLRNEGNRDGPATTERKLIAEAHLKRNLGITDSARERVRTKLAGVEIEDSPIKQRDGSRGRRDQELLSKIRGVSPTSSVSSNDSISVSGGRATLLGGMGSRLFSRHTKSESASLVGHAFPNEYSIPTIPIPPSPSEEIVPAPKPPESPSRFRRRTTTNASTSKSGVREISVRFDLPTERDEDDNILPATKTRKTGHSFPLTSTPKVPGSSVQQFIDTEANSFDSAKSFISAYNTLSSPKSASPPTRFRRESPSKLLRTLARATSVTPGSIARSTDSFVEEDFQTPAPAEWSSGPFERDDEEESIDEVDRTLDSIITSTEDARRRVRRIMNESRQAGEGTSLSPETSTEESVVKADTVIPEVSMWNEKSFFRRMARKVPGGWAFTPQPKFGRTIQADKDGENDGANQIQDLIIPKQTAETGAKWWEFWRTKRKTQDKAKPPDPLDAPPQQSQAVSPLRQTSPSIKRPPSPTRQSSPTKGRPALSTLSEKRLRLARSLSLLQSDIRTARQGIESLESRLEQINAASRLRTETSERALIARRQRGDPPPVITLPASAVVEPEFPATGTYVWLPFSGGWVVGMLWVILVVQAVVILVTRWEKASATGGWEPYSFGEWSRAENWPT